MILISYPKLWICLANLERFYPSSSSSVSVGSTLKSYNATVRLRADEQDTYPSPIFFFFLTPLLFLLGRPLAAIAGASIASSQYCWPPHLPSDATVTPTVAGNPNFGLPSSVLPHPFGFLLHRQACANTLPDVASCQPPPPCCRLNTSPTTTAISLPLLSWLIGVFEWEGENLKFHWIDNC